MREQRFGFAADSRSGICSAREPRRVCPRGCGATSRSDASTWDRSAFHPAFTVQRLCVTQPGTARLGRGSRLRDRRHRNLRRAVVPAGQAGRAPLRLWVRAEPHDDRERRLRGEVQGGASDIERVGRPAAESIRSSGRLVLVGGPRASRPGLGSDISFLKGFLQYYQFVPIGQPCARLGRARRHCLNFEGEELVPNERFFGGGATRVRGYREDDLGPAEHVRRRKAAVARC